MKNLNVGIIGGGLMCKMHSAAYGMAPIYFSNADGSRDFIPVRKAVCDINEQMAKTAAKRYLWEDYTDNWHELCARPDIDMIDIVTPTFLHKEMAIEAARNGKMIFCEKPMGLNAAECKEMLDAVNKYGVRHAIGFNKRRWPAVQFAKKLIDNGDIGDVIYFRGRFLSSFFLNESIPMSWRFQKEKSGVGAMTEAGTHLIDAARFLVGDIEEVVGLMQITIKERPILDKGADFFTKTVVTADTPMGKVETEDCSVFLGRTKSGVLVNIENTAISSGEGNDMGFEIWGKKGGIKWQEQYANEIWLSEESAPDDRKGFKIVEMSGAHAYADKLWGGAYFGLGLADDKAIELNDFMDACVNDRPYAPTFEDGYEAAKVIDAVTKSSETKQWVKVG